MLLSASLFLTANLIANSELADREVLFPGSEELYKVEVMDVARRGTRDYLVTWSPDGIIVHRRVDGDNLVDIIFPPGTWIGSRFFVQDGKVLLRTFHPDRGETFTDCDTATNLPVKDSDNDSSGPEYQALVAGLLKLNPDLSADTFDPRIGVGGSPANKEVLIAAFNSANPPVNQPPFAISKNLKVMAWGGKNLDFGYLNKEGWEWHSVLPAFKVEVASSENIQKVPTLLVTDDEVHFGIVLNKNDQVSWKAISVASPWAKPKIQVRDGLVCRDLGK